MTKILIFILALGIVFIGLTFFMNDNNDDMCSKFKECPILANVCFLAVLAVVYFGLCVLISFLSSDEVQIKHRVRYIKKEKTRIEVKDSSSKDSSPKDSLLWEKAFEITGITDPAVKDAIRRTY